MTATDLLDFDLVLDDIDESLAPAKPAVQQVVPVVESTVAVTSQAVSYQLKGDGTWGWNDLRDFVVHEIERCHGPQPRDLRKESGIFKSFMTRYPDGISVAIARAAFGPAHQGMWRGAPISVNRFCKASDVYFSDIIKTRI